MASARLALIPWFASPLVLRFRSAVELTDDQFYYFCLQNPDLRMERTANGEVIIMSPVGTGSGGRELEVAGQLFVWARRDGTGTAFGSSTGFTLPNGAVLSPDASWVSKARLAKLTAEQYEKFAPLCPEFVAEIPSPSDTLSDVQAKMREYIDNGAQLGWLIDPDSRRVYVYRPNQPVEELDDLRTVSGDAVLPGFVLELAPLWP